MSLIRVMASWLEITSQSPSEAKMAISSSVVRLSSCRSGVATTYLHPKHYIVNLAHVILGKLICITMMSGKEEKTPGIIWSTQSTVILGKLICVKLRFNRKVPVNVARSARNDSERTEIFPLIKV
jgi:hypothetical protein